MKKLILVLGTLVFTTSLFITGCTDDEEPPLGDPTIEFVQESGYVSSDVTLQVNTSYKIKIMAEENPETEAKLTSLKISSDFTQTGKASWDTTISINKEPSITFDLSLLSAPVEGFENLEFLVIDENSRSDQIELTVTTEGNVQKYENKDIGSYDEETIGSFFVTATGEVLDINQASGRQEDVDFLFFLGATNGSTIASPADEVAITVFAIGGWSVQNDTRFIHPAPIGHAEFDAIGSTYDFPEFNAALSTSRAVQLETNDVIFFETVGGKRGFIKVNNIFNRGWVANIDVVVEK